MRVLLIGYRNAHVWLALLMGLSAAGLSVAAHLRIDATLIDDAFITYRYAANLARGHGLVYNSGEWVLGTTTPLYAMLLGVIAAITNSEFIPAASKTLNVAFVLVAGVSAGLIGYRITVRPIVGAVVLAIVVLGPKTLFASVAGMETSLFLALLSLGILSMVSHRWLFAAATIGLAPLVRPEGLFAVAVTGAILLVSHFGLPSRERPSHRELFWAAFALLLPSLIWALVSVGYYGSLLPQSIVAKRAGIYPVGIAVSLGLMLRYLIDSSLFLRLLPDEGGALTLIGPRAFLLMLLLVLFILVAGGAWLGRRRLVLWSIPVLLAVLIAFYATSGTLIFPHYYALLEPFFKVSWWAGVYYVSSRLIKRWASEANQARLLTALGIVTALLILFPGLYYYPWKSVWRGQIDASEIDQSILRQAKYRAIALQIAPSLPDNSVVLMPEIGELGFFLDRVEVLDACGLVSPQVIPYLPVPEAQRASLATGVIPPALVRDSQPDLIITLEVFGRKGVLDAPWFWDDYVPVITWQGDWLPWESSALYVFSHKDFRAGLALQDHDFSQP
jgi:hypothetical protein